VIEWDQAHGPALMIFHDTFFIGILPLPNSARPEGQYSPTQNYCRILVTEFGGTSQAHVPRDDEEVAHGILASAEKPTLEFFQYFLAQVYPTAKISHPGWLTSFVISHRIASHFRSGNVFIAGDAAHIHSPAGGQGLNTSVQDALNLSWKLVIAEKIRQSGDADAAIKIEHLLSSYELERIANAKQVLIGTEKATKAMSLKGTLQQRVRNSLLYYFSSFKIVQDKLRENVSQLTVGYANISSPLISTATIGTLVSGVRAPNTLLVDGRTLYDVLSGITNVGRFALLIFSALPSDNHGVYDEAERVALQVRFRYGKYVEPVFVFPKLNANENKLRWDGIVIYDSKNREQGHLGGTFEQYAPYLSSATKKWAAYLIRPDLYVALSSSEADKITSFLDTVLPSK